MSYVLCPMLLAVVLIPILLSTHDVNQNILFVLLVIQVSFKRICFKMFHLMIWAAGYIIVFIYFRLSLCPCKDSWTVWFTPGVGPTSRRLFLGRKHPWWHTTIRLFLMNHSGPRRVDSHLHTERQCWLLFVCNNALAWGRLTAHFMKVLTET